jgi:hypothetical protein
MPGRVRAVMDMYYYTGSCAMAIADIQQNFIDRMMTSNYASACVSTPSCTAENIQVP